MVCKIRNLAPWHIAHSTGNFFSFLKHPLQIKFWSLVQILWKLLVCVEEVDSLQIDNFHKICTDDQNLTCKGCFRKEKKFQVNEPYVMVLDFEFYKLFTFKHFNV